MEPQIHIVGARPNFIKAAPVVSELRRVGQAPMLVHTGQHYERALSQVFFDQLGLPEPDRNLGVGSGSHGAQTARLMVALEDLFVEARPGRVVVYGDVNSTLAAAVVAAKLQIPVAHVEAGLRSFDMSMPEEVNRIVTDALADLHFTTSPEAADNLRAEGIGGGGVHFVGNPMIDTLVRFQDEMDVEQIRAEFGLSGPYAICTLHRPANVDQMKTASGLVEALGRLGERMQVVLPLHPRGRATLEAAGLTELVGVQVTDPMGYLEFMTLMTEATLVLTDSGGIQEETTVLGIPCLTLRENTERPITVTMGTNRLVGTDPSRITEAVDEALEAPPNGRTPPMWDGRAGSRIAKVLQG